MASAETARPPPLRADLSGKTAIVTGGGSGLGRHFALALADAGAVVVVGGRRLAPLEETVALVHARGGRARALTLDVADERSVDGFCKALAEERIDVLVNNAGVGLAGTALEMTAADWSQVIDANLTGAWLMARGIAGGMAACGGGSIINVSSVLATATQKGMAAYCASKAGLSHLTRVLALEWARHGVRVNAIEPGYFHTDLSAGYLATPAGEKMLKRIPKRRLGDPGELDGVLLLLASDASSYMTGSTLVVDGGLSLPAL